MVDSTSPWQVPSQGESRDEGDPNGEQPVSPSGLVAASIGIALHFGAGLTGIMLALNLPKFEQIFAELGIDLPPITAALVWIGWLPLLLLQSLVLAWPIVALLYLRRCGLALLSAILINGILGSVLSAVIVIGMFRPLIVIIHKLGS